MTRAKAKQMLVLDRGMLAFLILIAGIGGSWTRMELGVNSNTAAIEAGADYTKTEIADVKLAFIAADGIVANAHSTQFRRLDAEVSEVRRTVSGQAVNIGKIQAGVEYIVNNIDGN